MNTSGDNRGHFHEFISATLQRESEAREFLQALHYEYTEEELFQVAQLLVIRDASFEKDSSVIFLSSAARHDLRGVLDELMTTAAIQKLKRMLDNAVENKVDTLMRKVNENLERIRQLNMKS